MDFRLTDDQTKSREKFYSVCGELETKKPPSWVGYEPHYSIDECWDFHIYCTREIARRGWTTLSWPADYGGSGTIMDKVLLAEAMGYYGIPGIDIFGVDMLAPTLFAQANEAVKKRFLPPIATAEVMWCELWSEPNAGSDLASLSATAIKKGNEYIINGQKIWTTNAHHADWGFGVFKTDPAGKHHHNLSFLLLDMKTPGITIRPIPFLDGDHIYNEVFFDNVPVPVENIVGTENEGWAVVNTLAAFERSGIGQIMMMVRGLENLVTFCNETKRNGQPLSRDPVIRNRLSQAACEIEAARTLSHRIADLENRGELTLMESSGLKVFSSDLGERVAFLATDILGAFGQVKISKWAPLKGEWEKMYHDCFITTISMGTNEIQKNIISWYGLGLPRMK